jgi:hypothetical protein
MKQDRDGGSDQVAVQYQRLMFALSPFSKS